MYTDKEKQKEAARKAQQKWRNTHKTSVIPDVIPEANEKNVTPVIPEKIIPFITKGVIPFGEISDVVHEESYEALCKIDLQVQRGIVSILRGRKEAGLFDDSVERVKAALAYQEWYPTRTAKDFNRV